MNADELLKTINENLEELKIILSNEFGDEGHDIGDCGNAQELLGNAMTIDHDYDLESFLQRIAWTLEIPFEDFAIAYKEIEKWTAKDWAQKGAWEGFNNFN